MDEQWLNGSQLIKLFKLSNYFVVHHLDNYATPLQRTHPNRPRFRGYGTVI